MPKVRASGDRSLRDRSKFDRHRSFRHDEMNDGSWVQRIRALSKLLVRVGRGRSEGSGDRVD